MAQPQANVINKDGKQVLKALKEKTFAEKLKEQALKPEFDALKALFVQDDGKTKKTQQEIDAMLEKILEETTVDMGKFKGDESSFYILACIIDCELSNCKLGGWGQNLLEQSWYDDGAFYSVLSNRDWLKS